MKKSIHLSIVILCLVKVCFSSWNFASYHDYDATNDVVKQANTRCPDISHVYYLQGKSFEGREFISIAFSASSPEKHEVGTPEFKWVGNIHGNEVIGKEMVLDMINKFCDEYGKDKYITWLVDHTRIHFLPTMNPDSNNKVYSEPRKENGQVDWIKFRANANGTDLNRNWPDLDKLLFDGEGHGKNNHLMSWDEALAFKELEPETKAVMRWMKEVPFVVSACLHGGDLVANYPYDESRSGKLQEYSECPDDDVFRELAKSYSKNHGKMDKPHKKCDMTGNDNFEDGITNGAQWYSVKGGMQDFNYLSTNCFEITIELGCDKFPMGDKLPEAWNDNYKAMLAYMLQTHNGVKGVVTDKQKNPIANAVIKVYRKDGSQIDHNIWSNEDGDYFRLLVDGDYLVVASADKYKSEFQCVTVINDYMKEAEVIDFTLQNGSDGKSFDTTQCQQQETQEETEEQETDEFVERMLQEIYNNEG